MNYIFCGNYCSAWPNIPKFSQVLVFNANNNEHVLINQIFIETYRTVILYIV